MPCYDDSRDSSEYIREHEIKPLQEKLNLTTRLACEYCLLLEQQGSVVPLWATEWWGTHKKLDAKRKQEEARKQEDLRRRKTALDKLTPEELALLGIRRK